jgi:hypothetical protein
LAISSAEEKSLGQEIKKNSKQAVEEMKDTGKEITRES